MKTKLVCDKITNNYIKNLLRARGIQDIDRFLNPDESCLQSWRDLDNIVDGVNLIRDLPKDPKIAIIVDCDIDGYTSAAILIQYLSKLSLFTDWYIHEGKAHGLEEHWKIIKDKDYDLVIIPDAGSNDSEYAKEIACPILVIDHHIVEDLNFAPNMTVINNQTSSEYRNKNLSGAGMAYQFCRALDYFLEKEYAEDFIDLAALGLCGDMMSGLEIENQYIWKKGFSNVKNYFFLTLARKQAYSITGKVGANDETIISSLNPTTIAFYIVPLVNAMIRVGTFEEKERMLKAFIKGTELVVSHKRGAKGSLEEVAVESARECTNARAHQNKYKDEAVSRLEQRIFKYDLLENKILFICLEPEDKFPSELNGLIATQLSQKYKRPTMVARLNEDGYIKGSIRGLSNSQLDSFKNYLTSTGLFEYVQGHDNAAGFSLQYNKVEELHTQANKELANYDFGDKYYEVDFERQALSDDLIDLIEEISNYKNIWSQQCNEPLIHITDLHFTAADFQIMGKNLDTIKITKNGIAYMKFFAKDMIEELKGKNNIKMEIIGKANMNEWMGNRTPQIFIENCEIKEDKVTDF